MAKASSSSGSGPDGTTITTDSNGDLTVLAPSEDVIGDFETGFGGYSYSADDSNGHVRRNTGYSGSFIRGSYAVQIKRIHTGEKELWTTNPMDVSDYDTLEIPIYYSLSETDTGVEIRDGTGSVLWSVAGSNRSAGNEDTAQIDISSLTSLELHIVAYSNATNQEMRINTDNIRLKNSDKVTVDSIAGN